MPPRREGDGQLTAEATESFTSYYYFAGQRVAMRQDTAVYFIVGDHLGTTSLVLDAAEAYHSETRHYPYGTERWAAGAVPTDYRFTGQRFDSYTQLTIMGARWYDACLNHFVSPDSIIPDSVNPQSYNRYSYVLGNPLKYRDLSGHLAEGEDNTGDLELTLDLLRLANDIAFWLQSVHPAPDGFHWVEVEGFRITKYYTPLESEFSGVELDSVLGLEGKGMYKEDFLYSFSGVAGQGSGLAESGELIGAVNNPDGWNYNEDPPVLNNPDTSAFGVKKRLPEPMKTIAVLPEPYGGMIPERARVYIPALDVQLSDHNGFVRASDHSRDLGRKQIDFYAGLGEASLARPPKFGSGANHTIYFLAPD